MKVFVHVGLDKTGTTSIQKWFTKNAGLTFTNCNLRYPRMGLYWGHHIGIANYCGFGLDEDIKRSEADGGDKDEIEEFFAKCPERDTLISSEHFSYNRSDFGAKRLKDLLGQSNEVKIVLVLRTIPSFLRSKYSEEVKWGYSGSFENYCEGISQGMADFAAVVQYWQNHFGPENVILGVFEDMKRDLIPSFFQLLGRSAPEGAIVPPKSQNQSMGYGDSEVLTRCFRKVSLRSGVESYRFWNFYNTLPRPSGIRRLNSKEFSYQFSDEQKQTILEQTRRIMVYLGAEEASRFYQTTVEGVESVSQNVNSTDAAAITDYVEFVVDAFKPR